MPGNPDPSSSIASFEEIDTSCDSNARAVEDVVLDVVPDVLYVLQRSSRGRIVDTQKSSQPFEVDLHADAQDDKNPIIEILTTVNAGPNYKHRGYPQPPTPLMDSDSDSGVDAPASSSSSRTRATRMVIHSPLLKSALRAVVGYYPGVDFMAERVVIRAPYRVLVHHRADLARFKHAQPACHSPEQAAETSRHIDVLLAFLDETFGPRIALEQQRHRRAHPCATFDMLWLLFQPGEVFYARGASGLWTAHVVSRVRYDNPQSDDEKSMEVDSWRLGFSGGRIRRGVMIHTIDVFAGEQAISSLPIVPASLFPAALPAEVPVGGETMEEKQVRLGKLYWDLTKAPTYKEYLGPRLEANGPGGKLSDRVVVDAEGNEHFSNSGPYALRRDYSPDMSPRRGGCGAGASRARPRGRRGGRRRELPGMTPLPSFQPRCGCTACDKQAALSPGQLGKFAGFEDLDPKSDKPPKSDLYYLVMDKHIAAFALGERRWADVYVEHLTDVKPDREAFKHLVLEEDVKHTVKTLIGKFASAGGTLSPWPRDLIRNKGEGRIFLLHGSPGVGKTATCEAAAELAQRPLLCLTSGDIGSSADVETVEQHLSHFLRLGERYGALVLLDEADVYLERRRSRDLHRNGLVSVFLRALEYFKGVLFLTTNRVSSFDSAFTSRIHVVLHYRRLGDADRARVWDNSFDRLERDAAGRVHVSLAARDFARAGGEVLALRLNGRQIKNALQVAVALAESEAAEAGGFALGAVRPGDSGGDVRVVVSDRHIRAVIKMNRGFKDFTSSRSKWAGDSEDDKASVEGGDEAAGYTSGDED